jgi:hypothetical protein
MRQILSLHARFLIPRIATFVPTGNFRGNTRYSEGSGLTDQTK